MSDPLPQTGSRASTLHAADFLGEIIEASTTRFVAQCPPERLHAPPAFGAFVKVSPRGAPTTMGTPPERDPFADPASPGSLTLPPGTPDDTLYALVFLATTGSAAPGRRPAAYGLDEESLRLEQPQIFDLLCTEFAGLHVGFAREGWLRPYLPPHPPRLHALVTACAPAEVCALTESLDFLRALLHASGEGDPDELIAACLRNAYEHRGRDFAFLVRAGKQLAALLHDDPDRLNALLRK